jgi:hypothetical protein
VQAGERGVDPIRAGALLRETVYDAVDRIAVALVSRPGWIEGLTRTPVHDGCPEWIEGLAGSSQPFAGTRRPPDDRQGWIED